MFRIYTNLNEPLLIYQDGSSSTQIWMKLFNWGCWNVAKFFHLNPNFSKAVVYITHNWMNLFEVTELTANICVPPGLKPVSTCLEFYTWLGLRDLSVTSDFLGKKLSTQTEKFFTGIYEGCSCAWLQLLWKFGGTALAHLFGTTTVSFRGCVGRTPWFDICK